MYYEAHPTRAERKDNSQNDWLRKQGDVTYNETDARKVKELNDMFKEKHEALERAGYISHKHRDRSAYNIFITNGIKPLIDIELGKALLRRHIPRIGASIWKYHIVKLSITEAYGAEGAALFDKVDGGQASQAEVDALAKLKSGNDYKAVVWVIVTGAIDDPSVYRESYMKALGRIRA